LWHGASWTFVVWGGLHGLYLGLEKFIDDKTGKITQLVLSHKKTIAGFIYALFTFFLVNITWVFFRAQGFKKAWDIVRSMFGMQNGEPLLTTLALLKVAVVITLMVVFHWLLRNTTVMQAAAKLPWALVGTLWAMMLLLLVWSQESTGSFIYFQF